MNKENRKELYKALRLIEDAKEIIERMKDAEQLSFDNLPDSLQQSERGTKLEENANALDDAFSNLDEAIDNINTTLE